MTQKWRREKDGLWAVLAWLSILAYRNGAKREGLGDKLAKIAPGKIPSWSKVCTARRPMHAMVLDSGCSNTVFTWRQKAFCALALSDTMCFSSSSRFRMTSTSSSATFHSLTIKLMHPASAAAACRHMGNHWQQSHHMRHFLGCVLLVLTSALASHHDVLAIESRDSVRLFYQAAYLYHCAVQHKMLQQHQRPVQLVPSNMLLHTSKVSHAEVSFVLLGPVCCPGPAKVAQI